MGWVQIGLMGWVGLDLIENWVGWFLFLGFEWVEPMS